MNMNNKEYIRSPKSFYYLHFLMIERYRRKICHFSLNQENCSYSLADTVAGSGVVEDEDHLRLKEVELRVWMLLLGAFQASQHLHLV